MHGRVLIIGKITVHKIPLVSPGIIMPLPIRPADRKKGIRPALPYF